MKQLIVRIETCIAELDKVKNVFGSVGYWNHRGKEFYEKNQRRELGSERTQNLALSQPFEHWVMDNLLCDIKTSLKGTNLKCGLSGSHIWVSHPDNTRMLLISFER